MEQMYLEMAEGGSAETVIDGKVKGYSDDKEMLSDYYRIFRQKEPLIRQMQRRPISCSTLDIFRDSLKKMELRLCHSKARGESRWLIRTFKQLGLKPEERMAVALLCYTEAKTGEGMDPGDLAEFVCDGDRLQMMSFRGRMKEDAPAFKAGLLEMGGASMPFIPRAQVGLGSKVKYHVFGIPAEDPDTVSKPGEGREIPEGKGLKEIKSPRQIYDELSRYMIGQEAAKKAVSVALFGHYQRISGKGAPTKSNILLYGPTGCGKTYLAELAAQLLDVPFIVVDATQYTETGYTGKDIEDMFKVLYKAAGRDEKKAARGIIFVDELDKLAGLDESASRQQRDVSGQGVQEGLLKAMEGGDYPGRPFSSQNVLFMAGGAFSQMDRICREHKEMGFLAKPWRERSAVPSVEDFVRFGMLPELMGRFQVTAGLHPLSEADLEKILAKPANSLVSQYQKAFAEQGITLDFAPEALKTVAARAAKLGTGARGLKAELERTVGPLMFEHFGGDKKVITVTPEMVC